MLKSIELSAQSISVSPSRMFFVGSEKQELTQQVTLTNSGTIPVSFRASLMDWNRDSIGEKQYFPPNTQKLSNASWIEVLPNVVEIGPGTKQSITVTMHVPKESSLRDSLTHCMLFLTQINEQSSKSSDLPKNRQIGVIVKLEFGVHVYYTPAAVPTKNLDFLSFDDRGTVSDGKQKVRRVAIKIKNRGNVVTDGSVRFEVTNTSSGDELSIAPKVVSILPGDEQIVYLDLPLNLNGHYLLVALIDCGEETNLKVAKKELDFSN